MTYSTKEKQNAAAKRLRDKHSNDRMCTRCASPAEIGRKLCKYHRDYAAHYNSKAPLEKLIAWRERTRDNLKKLVFDKYGNRCACCGQDTPQFLTIDHIDGSGAQHRREGKHNGSGSGLWRWLKRNGFPAGFRILCANCNLAMGIYGTCPHGTLAPQATFHPANKHNPQRMAPRAPKMFPFDRRPTQPGEWTRPRQIVGYKVCRSCGGKNMLRIVDTDCEALRERVTIACGDCNVIRGRYHRKCRLSKP